MASPKLFLSLFNKHDIMIWLLALSNHMVLDLWFN